MRICKVVGKVISTQKNEKLVGYSIVLVRSIALTDAGKTVVENDTFAAVDAIGCGEGNLVLVACGANARLACKNADTPVDMAVVGIIDSGI